MASKYTNSQRSKLLDAWIALFKPSTKPIERFVALDAIARIGAARWDFARNESGCVCPLFIRSNKFIPFDSLNAYEKEVFSVQRCELHGVEDTLHAEYVAFVDDSPIIIEASWTRPDCTLAIGGEDGQVSISSFGCDPSIAMRCALAQAFHSNDVSSEASDHAVEKIEIAIGSMRRMTRKDHDLMDR